MGSETSAEQTANIQQKAAQSPGNLPETETETPDAKEPALATQPDDSNEAATVANETQGQGKQKTAVEDTVAANDGSKEVEEDTPLLTTTAASPASQTQTQPPSQNINTKHNNHNTHTHTHSMDNEHEHEHEQHEHENEAIIANENAMNDENGNENDTDGVAGQSPPQTQTASESEIADDTQTAVVEPHTHADTHHTHHTNLTPITTQTAIAKESNNNNNNADTSVVSPDTNTIEKSPIFGPQQYSFEYEQQLQEFYHCPFPINIIPEVFRMASDAMNLRRYFHANPELSWHEEKTAENVARYCRTLGLSVKENVAKTGVLSVIHGGYTDGPCILLRADMDALPIQEENECSFKSCTDGVSHACGHDCHMAILLSVARILSMPNIARHLHGCIKFCFQPAEEGGAGAKHMIEAGVLEADTELQCPRVDAVYGLHVWSYKPFGKIVCKSGPLMAGSEHFRIIVTGKGGDGGGQPHSSASATASALSTATADEDDRKNSRHYSDARQENCATDCVLALTQLCLQLHTVVSRDIPATEAAVLTIGKMNVGNYDGLMANSGEIEGTFRWFRPYINRLIHQRIRNLCDGIEVSFGVSTKLITSKNPYPATINHVLNTAVVHRAAEKVLPEGILTRDQTMGAEDFSFFLQQRPGAYFFVCCGVDDEEEIQSESGGAIGNGTVPKKAGSDGGPKVYAHHTSTFRVDERCLTVGIQVFVNLILELMSQSNVVQAPANESAQNEDNNNIDVNEDETKMEQLPDYNGRNNAADESADPADPADPAIASSKLIHEHEQTHQNHIMPNENLDNGAHDSNDDLMLVD